MAETGNIFVRIGASIDDFEKNMRIVEQNIKNIENRFSGMKAVGDKLSSVGKSLTVGVTLPLAAAAGASLKAAGDFESMQNTFQAVSGATSAQMQKMSQLAKQLGNDITLPGTSATDAAAAMTELVKAGLSIDDTFKAVKATLQLSAAAQIDNAEAATIVGQALNSFGLSGDKAIMVADLLANSANASAGEITDMAYALQAGGSVAAMAGQSINDFTTAIALMANAGIVGSDAGTSLKSMLMSLMSPTDKAAKLMQELGIQIYDANGKMLPLPQLVEQFSSKLGGMTQEQRNAALATIFGSDAIRAANIVLMAGTDNWNKMSEAVNKAGGAQDVAASKMQGFNGALESFRSAVETLAITIGEKLLPILTPIIQKITEWVDRFSELSPITQNVIMAVAGFMAVLGPIVLLVGKFMTALVSIKAGLAAFGIGATAASSAAGAAAGGVSILGSAFSLLTGPIGIAIAAITAAIAIGVLLYKNWDQISAWLAQTWETIKQTAINVWNSIANFFVGLWDGMVSVTTSTWNSITNFLAGVWNGIVSTAQGIWNGFVSFITGLWNGMVTTATTIWTTLKTVVVAIVQGFVNAVVNFFVWLYNHNYYFQDLVDFIANAFRWLQKTATAIWNTISTTLTTIWNNIKATATTVWNAISNFFNTTWNTIKSVATTIWNSIASTLSGIWNKVKNTASSIWNSIKNTITSLFNSAKNSVTSIANSIWSGISNIWNKIVNTIKSIGSRIWNAIVEPFNIAKQKVLSIVSDAYNWGRNLIQNVVDGIKSMIGKVASAAKSVASTVARFLGFHSPAKEGPGSDADKWMPNLMNMLQEGIEKNIPRLQATLNTALEIPVVSSPALVTANGINIELPAMQTNTMPQIVIEQMVVRNDNDIERIAQRLWQLQKSRLRGQGR
ncbi:phage tail tape measure protein [Thermoanaerobacterium thermosaccharolyticum]|uniref:phage tail tape measure protein n=1 Tax=Thermoanaerobacterium thermosaccharolyticum TaxID=1517 RepID=UPI003DAA0DDE